MKRKLLDCLGISTFWGIVAGANIVALILNIMTGNSLGMAMIAVACLGLSATFIYAQYEEVCRLVDEWQFPEDTKEKLKHEKF